jgi:N-acetylneuraminate synthase
VILSVGLLPIKQIDELVAFYASHGTPLCLVHCVDTAPQANAECNLNQIDFLRDRYPRNVVGYSCYEKKDWIASLVMAYGKGARTFERYVDLPAVGDDVIGYSLAPDQVNLWFKAFRKAKRVCGNPGSSWYHSKTSKGYSYL